MGRRLVHEHPTRKLRGGRQRGSHPLPYSRPSSGDRMIAFISKGRSVPKTDEEERRYRMRGAVARVKKRKVPITLASVSIQNV